MCQTSLLTIYRPETPKTNIITINCNSPSQQRQHLKDSFPSNGDYKWFKSFLVLQGHDTSTRRSASFLQHELELEIKREI